MLPSERRLAELLLISRTTVVAAYGVLRAEGRLRSRRGSGTRVCDRRHSYPIERPFAQSSVAVFQNLIDRDSDEIDFSTAGLGSERVLTAELQSRAAAELTSLTETPGYHPYGLPSLRETIASYLSKHDLPTNERQILVTNGAQQAISLITHLLVDRGSSVIVENPTYAGALDAFLDAGARLIGIPVEEQLVSPEPLRRLIRRERPRLLYVMPTFQNPTGAVSTLARRRQLLNLAADGRTMLVEDNTLAPLGIERTPPPPIAAFDRDGHVLTIGSLSKVVWAGLRVGWIRAHPKLIDRLVRVRAVADLGGSLPSQTLAQLVLNDLEPIAEFRSAQLANCLELASGLVREHLRDWQFVEPTGGQSLWLQLPHGEAEAFAQAALRRRVTVVPGCLLSPDRSFTDHVRVQFHQPPRVIEAGIRRLGEAWADYTSASVNNDLAAVV
jgi:DNA-binding transcriptional MocR family regulator